MKKLFSGQFCFVQVETGRVVEISYEEDSHPEGVNLKKSIAAAFQANFQNQEEEEEEDPQSLHMAHYRYRLQWLQDNMWSQQDASLYKSVYFY